MISRNLKYVLDEKLWTSAKKLIRHFEKAGFKVKQLDKIDEEHVYKMHLICKKSYQVIAIELREKCNIESYFEKFVKSCQADRVGVSIYFAVPEYIEGEETLISHVQREQLKKLGIGLFIVKESSVFPDIGTITCDRRFALPPGSSLSKYKNDLHDIIKKYNEGKCLDAIRDLCEKVEDATVRLALKAARLNKISATVDEINNNEFDWAGLITILSLRVWRGNPQTQIITDTHLRDSLNEFRGKRNLSDHRKTPKELRALEAQYPEAMLQGIRLLRELIRLYNNLR